VPADRTERESEVRGRRNEIADRFVPTTTFRAFVIPGESHTLLGAVDTTTSGGVALEAWLAAMLSGDPGWATVGL
jgi:hypothetical protein